ncbi:glycosyl transferase family 90 [Pedobacter caeni]|uniref:Glycosyl transferase family 90 n=1 Tax=Pedobacter caeni TaxID=288992 RepID=A0A1M5DM81_9SPHI|nr:glycosyl transferase family 90 [Pedobacter caeni]SHF68109.1 Glycosyl transferase family 90 [Pedobacter caeni]
MNLASLKIELKRNKLPYYIKNLLKQAVPKKVFEERLAVKLKSIEKFSTDEILERVRYYNQLDESLQFAPGSTRLDEVKLIKSANAYKIDTLAYARYFPKHFKADFIFGDVVHVASEPSFQKSRPIASDNANGILLNLDRKRHFFFVDDPISFENKKDMLIGRGAIVQAHRIDFMNKYFGGAGLDLGQTNVSGGNPDWIKPKISMYDHLKYKFILSLEGYDVATNLKWIMSSNSVAVMPKPKYETWFMEGTLEPNVHYIQIADDYSNLMEVLDYYITHPEKAKEIAANANAFVRKFQNKEKEDLISLLVLDKYFRLTSQY